MPLPGEPRPLEVHRLAADQADRVTRLDRPRGAAHRAFDDRAADRRYLADERLLGLRRDGAQLDKQLARRAPE